MKFNVQSIISFALCLIVLCAFGAIIGWQLSDLAAIGTRIVYVTLFWVVCSLYAWIHNGRDYDTWKVFRGNADADSRVFSALILGSAFILGRPF